MLLNNPLTLVDPDGREPNKSQATDPNRLLINIRGTAGATARDQLAVLGDYKTLGGASPSHKRYIYTTKAGWIDLVHFFNVAKELDQMSLAKRAAASALGGFPLWQKTKEIENDQEANGNVGTAWSYEDAPSNYYGWIFWNNYYDPKGNLSDLVQSFLNGYGGAAPDTAPNWKDMWSTERPYKRQFPQNKSFSPKYTR